MEHLRFVIHDCDTGPSLCSSDSGLGVLEEIFPGAAQCRTFHIGTPIGSARSSDIFPLASLRHILSTEKPSSVLALGDLHDVQGKIYGYLGKRYGRGFSVLSFDDGFSGTTLCAHNDASSALRTTTGRIGIPCAYMHSSSVWRGRAYSLSYKSSRSGRPSLSVSQLIDYLNQSGTVHLAVDLPFSFQTATELTQELDHPQDVVWSSASLPTILRSLPSEMHLVGLCVQNSMKNTLARMRREFSGWLDADNGHTASSPSDFEVAQILTDWLLTGSSCPSFDECPLSSDATHLNETTVRDILDRYKVGESKYRGTLASQWRHIERDALPLETFSEIVRLLQLTLPGIAIADQSVRNKTRRLPPLERSSRSREFDSYDTRERMQVVREFLFHDGQHRQMDRDILHLDPAYSHGYQSMGILHYLGLKKAFKGIFAGYTVAEAIKELENQPNADDFKEIIVLLRQIGVED